MPIQIVRDDITKIQCDAIVNAANNSLLGGGGGDGAIHRAAGKGLLLECMKLGGCKTGQAKITGAYRLPCRYVIHTVGPKWRGGASGERELLESCYRKSLCLAQENGCKSIAFPLISSGVYGYPKDQALCVAMDVISEYLVDHEMLVYVVIFDKAVYQISEKLVADIQEYIDDNYMELHMDSPCESRCVEQFDSYVLAENHCMQNQEEGERYAPNEPDKSVSIPLMPTISHQQMLSLNEAIDRIDESFSQMLLRVIDEKGMTDAQCYKKANIDRKLFSKIRSDVHYRPSKQTAIAFAIALELSLDEMKDMLMKAGYALSHSNKFDIIIEYFIQNENYNIYEINEALFAFDQSLLGA